MSIAEMETGDLLELLGQIQVELGERLPALSCSRLDDLCQRMLQLGAFADGTSDMRASEIKERLLPFFGQEIIDRSVAAICGENAEALPSERSGD